MVVYMALADSLYIPSVLQISLHRQFIAVFWKLSTDIICPQGYILILGGRMCL